MAIHKRAGSQKHYFLAYILARLYRSRYTEPDLEDYGYSSESEQSWTSASSYCLPVSHGLSAQ